MNSSVQNATLTDTTNPAQLASLCRPLSRALNYFLIPFPPGSLRSPGAITLSRTPRAHELVRSKRHFDRDDEPCAAGVILSPAIAGSKLFFDSVSPRLAAVARGYYSVAHSARS